MSKYDKWYIIGKPFCSTFRICKIFSKFAKIEFFYRKIQLYSKNVCKQKFVQKWKIIHFWKALDHAISNMQIIFIFFFAELVQFVSLCQRLSKKLNFIKIWQVEVGQNKDLVCYRKKQSFRQCAWGLRKLVLKPGFRPKGRALGM